MALIPRGLVTQPNIGAPEQRFAPCVPACMHLPACVHACLLLASCFALLSPCAISKALSVILSSPSLLHCRYQRNIFQPSMVTDVRLTITGVRGGPGESNVQLSRVAFFDPAGHEVSIFLPCKKGKNETMKEDKKRRRRHRRVGAGSPITRRTRGRWQSGVSWGKKKRISEEESEESR